MSVGRERSRQSKRSQSEDGVGVERGAQAQSTPPAAWSAARTGRNPESALAEALFPPPLIQEGTPHNSHSKTHNNARDWVREVVTANATPTGRIQRYMVLGEPLKEVVGARGVSAELHGAPVTSQKEITAHTGCTTYLMTKTGVASVPLVAHWRRVPAGTTRAVHGRTYRPRRRSVAPAPHGTCGGMCGAAQSDIGQVHRAGN